MLVTLFLIERKMLKKPLLYLSLYFKQHKTEYYDVLTHVRNTGDYERWICFFMQGILQVSNSIGSTTRKILALKEELKHQVKDSYNLIDCFFENPFVEADKIKEYTNASVGTVYKLLDAFESQGILVQTTTGKRNRVFCFKRYVDLLNDTNLTTETE